MSEKVNAKFDLVSVDESEAIIQYYYPLKLKLHLKVVTVDTIKELVDKGKSICLNNCYIKDFSYSYLCGESKDTFLSLRSSNIINSKRKPLVNFEAKNAFFDGDVDFEYAYFKGNATFKHSCFCNNIKNFNYTYFENCHVDFSHVFFGDTKINFESSVFEKGNINFSYSNFGKGLVNFEKIQFDNGDISFDSATFSDGLLSFSKSTFGEGKLSFKQTKFSNGDIFFNHVIFNNTYIDFYSIQSKENKYSFSNAEFNNGTLIIRNTNFENNDLLFNVAKFHNAIVDFYNVNFYKQISFDHSFLKDSVFMFQNCSFYTPLNIDLNLNNTFVFYRCTNNNLINFNSKESDYIKSKLALFDINNMGLIQLDWDKDKYSILDFNLNFYEEQRNYPENMKIFRMDCSDILDQYKIKELCMLKEIYHNQGRYDWEDDSYVKFKRLDSKQLPYKKFLKKAIFNLLYLVGKYGTDPFSIFITMFLVVLVFGFVFLSPFTDISPLTDNPPIWSPFYYSIITFFTIGYGDLYAQDWFTAALCGFEGFLGVFLMSYFSVSLVRKILR